MKAKKLTIRVAAAATVIAIISVLSSCNTNPNQVTVSKAELDSLRNQVNEMVAGNAILAENLMKFDTLDFTVFSHQQWVRLHESHAEDIKVHWPDGRVVVGIEQHIKDLDAMFPYAPDTRITEHPVKFGSADGQWTAVTGVFEATFTEPMAIGNGKFIQPTGKKVKMPMCTIGRWENGVMVEEWLFWDNKTYMTQLGLMN